MSYKLETFKNGKTSILNTSIGETMHSSIGPWEEANLIYVGQSNLKARSEDHTLGPLVIYDIGLGIAANALAAILEYEKLGQNIRPLHLISFENDLEGIQFALSQPSMFSFLHNHPKWTRRIREEFLVPYQKGATHLFLESESKIKWELLVGDFQKIIATKAYLLPPPELIYFDLYSPKSSPHLWNLRTFKDLYKLTFPSGNSQQTSTLITYSSSTAVRSAMLLAGFEVGYGIQTSSKLETTIASTHLKNITCPLGQKWLSHLKRSSKPLPPDHNYQSPSEALEKIIKKLQIANF